MDINRIKADLGFALLLFIITVISRIAATAISLIQDIVLEVDNLSPKKY